MAKYSDRQYLNILQNIFKFNDFKSNEQKLAIKTIVRGKYKNLIISMPSNSGKSLCYLMPRFFWQSGVVLVISSHITRIANEIEYLTDLGISATTITSETSYADRDVIIEAFEDTKNCPYFFYVTPEMIDKGSEQVRDFIDHLLRTKVCLVAVNEAQLLVDSNFRKSYQALNIQRSKLPNIPWIAFTTASQETLQEITVSLSMSNALHITASCVRDDIFLDVKPLNCLLNIKDMITDLLEQEIKLEDKTQKTYKSGIIYCQNNEEADRIAQELCNAAVPSESYHLLKPDRDSILKEWIDGSFPILVTHEGTFNLGISRSALKFVVFMTYPQSIRTFYQRTGKINVHGGRARIIYPQQTGYVNFKVSDYIGSIWCRHKFIANNIAEEKILPCGSKCDNCVKINTCINKKIM